MANAPQTAKQLLAERFERKTAEGLVDVKFFLSKTTEVTTDEVLDDLNGFYEAFERGDCVLTETAIPTTH